MNASSQLSAETSTNTAFRSTTAHAQQNRRLVALALLAAAVGLGGLFRFVDLPAYEMSADEGASWAAASAPSINRVLELQPRLNPGKFAVHEIVLHEWIGLFGDGLISMRALSAIAGTLAIVAVFFLVRELLALNEWESNCASDEDASGEKTVHIVAAAYTALLFALNLVFIKYAREARMYSIALLCALIQVGAFLRSLRRPTPSVLVLEVLFTALAIASTFTMVLILVPESLWLAYLVIFSKQSHRYKPTAAALALAGGITLLAGPAIIYLHARTDAPALVAYSWSSRPPVWAPLSMFNKATGSIGFPIVFMLLVWGIARGWRLERDAVVFVLLWLLAPPILVLAGSYLIRPAFVERYMLASFVPFFLLVALGLCHIRAALAQYAFVTLVAIMAIGHVYAYWRHPHDVQWREAVEAASRAAGYSIVVAPPYAVDVVRYYLRHSRSGQLIGVGTSNAATLAIVAESGVAPADVARLTAAFPRLLTRLRGVMVRERSGLWGREHG